MILNDTELYSYVVACPVSSASSAADGSRYRELDPGITLRESKLEISFGPSSGRL